MLNNNSKKISQPTSLKLELMEHQKTAIKEMMDRENGKKLLLKDQVDPFIGAILTYEMESNIGVLCDKVGSGKTLMILSLIIANKKPLIKDTTFFGTPYLSLKLKENFQDINSNLIIVPHSLMSQWKDFIKITNLKYTEISKTLDIKDFAIEKKMPDIILLSSTMTKKFFKIISQLEINEGKNYKWKRIFVDEADTINIIGELNLIASYIWLVTATPNRVFYRLNNKFGMSKSLMQMPHYCFDYLKVINDNNFIDQSIKLPRIKRLIIPCKTPAEITIFENIVPTNVIEMINAGNGEDAIKTLNCNMDTKENIYEVVTRKIKESIENNKSEIAYLKKKKYTGIKKIKNMEEIENITNRIRKHYKKIDNIREKIYDMNDEICPVCLCDFEKPIITQCCHQTFDLECLLLSLQKSNKCPCCQKKITMDDIHIVTNEENNDQYKRKLERLEKLETLLNLIKSKKKGKFLVFSGYQSTFKKIIECLKKEKVNCDVLSGSQKSIDEKIKKFKTGNLNVLMLNARNFGAGLNLEVASDLVIFHRFNYDLEEQVIGRSQRLGRKNALNVHYLVHSNESSIVKSVQEFEDIDFEEWLETI